MPHHPQRQPDAYWDLATFAANTGAYRDFDGNREFHKDALNRCRRPDGKYVWDVVCSPMVDIEGIYEATRDITLNLVCDLLLEEHRDGTRNRTEFQVSANDIFLTCRTVYEMLTCRHWIKVAEGEFREPFKPIRPDIAANTYKDVPS